VIMKEELLKRQYLSYELPAAATRGDELLLQVAAEEEHVDSRSPRWSEH